MIRTTSGYPGGCIRGPAPPYSWCPGCYCNCRQRTNYKGCLGYRSSSPKKPYIDWSLRMRRPSQVSGPGKNVKFEFPDKWFSDLYPTLAAGLIDPWWDDGKPRDTWNLKVSFATGGCSLVLTDPGAKLVLFTSGASLDETLGLLESTLANGSASWRKSKY